MGIWDSFRKQPQGEERSTSEHSYGSFSITSYFGNETRVTEEQALKIPAVSSSIELITSSVAQLPIYLYKKNDKGETIRVDDKRTFLLNREPNDSMNGHSFKRQLVRDYLFYGSSYTKIEKVRNEVIALYNLPIEEISVTKYRQNGYKQTAKINLMYSETKEEFFPDEIIIVLKDSKDGFTSTGILVDNAETLGLALDEQDYTISILKNGALPIGVLKATSRLTEKAIERLRASWENLYGGTKKAGKTIILEEGLEYTPISMKPNELDLTNVRKHTVSEIARIFNVPESMINSSANKYASNEQNNIYFLQYCLAPIITSMESAFNKSLLLESEKQEGYFFKFDVSELLRTTEKEKIETVVKAMEKGLLSINEARQKIDMPNIKDDYFTWNLGSIFYDPTSGLFTIPNMGQTIDPKNPPKPEEELEKEKSKDESEEDSTKEDSNEDKDSEPIIDDENKDEDKDQ